MFTEIELKSLMEDFLNWVTLELSHEQELFIQLALRWEGTERKVSKYFKYRKLQKCERMTWHYLASSLVWLKGDMR